MCCDRSPAAFLQRYNFPSEQAWRQVPRLALLSPPHERETLPSPISPLLQIRRNRLSLHRLSPYPPLRMGFKRGEINHGEMAEWSIAAVLKTVELRGSGGSNPSLSAEKERVQITSDLHPFFFSGEYHSNQPYYPKKLFYHSSSFPSNE